MPGLPSKYRVERTLGTGSSGTVVLAIDQQLDRPVAVKELAPALAADPSFIEGFREEARVMAQLDNEHCVRVYEFLQEPGHAWLVSEFIDGASLRAIIDKAGPLTGEQSLGVIKGALEGLHAAHQLGLVHRDVKPENMLSDREGVSKLADFGQAIPSSTGPGAAGGVPSGTAAYMSPEQAANASVDHRSDLYSAGIVLFELLTGQVPFRGDSALAVMRQHITEAVPDARTVKPSLAEPLAMMLRHATAHDPGERPQDAEALLVELEAAAVATYGEDWEERSSHKKLVLAALAALGLLGTAAAGASAEAATGLATVGPAAATPWALIGAGVLAAIVVLGGVVAVRGNLLGGHSATAVVSSSSPTATASAAAATPSVAPATPAPSPEVSAGPAPSATPGSTPAATSTPTGSAARRTPATYPSPTHTFIVTASMAGRPPSLAVTTPRVYYQQCQSNYATPAPAVSCGFLGDGYPYYSQAQAYPSSRGMDCGFDGAFNLAEQYDFTNTYSVDIPITVNWDIQWADGSSAKPSSVSQVIKAGTGGTHDASTSTMRAQPSTSTASPKPSLAYGSARYTLTWSDPSGAHFISSEQPMYWACSSFSLA